MTSVIKSVCTSVHFACQTVVYILLRDLTNITWYKELADIEEQKKLTSLLPDNVCNEEINEAVATTLVNNDCENVNICEIKIENGIDEREDTHLSQTTKEFDISNQESSFITSIGLINNEICINKIFGNNIDFNDTVQLNKEFETSIINTSGRDFKNENLVIDEKDVEVNSVNELYIIEETTPSSCDELQNFIFKTQEKSFIQNIYSAQEQVFQEVSNICEENEFLKVQNEVTLKETCHSVEAIKENSKISNLSNIKESPISKRCSKEASIIKETINNLNIDTLKEIGDLVETAKENLEVPLTLTNYKYLDIEFGDMLKERYDLVDTVNENIELPPNLSNIDESSTSSTFSEVTSNITVKHINIENVNSFPNQICCDECSEKYSESKNEFGKAEEHKKLPEFMLETCLNAIEYNAHIKDMSLSEINLQTEMTENFCDNTRRDVDWIKQLLSEIVSHSCANEELKESSEQNICKSISEYEDVIDSDIEDKCNCKCVENHGCLMVVHFDEDLISHKILPENERLSVGTGSETDWLFNPAICLLPSKDVFDVSLKEVQQINEQEVNHSNCYQENKFKEQYVEQWLYEVEQFCSNSSLFAGDFKEN